MNSQDVKSEPKPWTSSTGVPSPSPTLSTRRERSPAWMFLVCGPPPAERSTGVNSDWNFATNASTSASGTDGSAITASSAPTDTVSPSGTTSRRIVPSAGLSNALAIFEVSMSAIS